MNNLNFCDFNLNSFIKVKFTDKGFQRLADLHNEYINQIKDWKFRTLFYYKNKIDSDGYYQMQMWEFIQYFGNDTPNIHLFCDFNIKVNCSK